MIATITGMLVEVGYVDRKDAQGRSYKEPFAVVYSGGEAVKIPNLSVDPNAVGSTIDVSCMVKLSSWEGRSYLSIKPISD